MLFKNLKRFQNSRETFCIGKQDNEYKDLNLTVCDCAFVRLRSVHSSSLHLFQDIALLKDTLPSISSQVMVWKVNDIYSQLQPMLFSTGH